MSVSDLWLGCGWAASRGCMKLISSSLWSHVVPILRPTALSLPCHSWTRIGLSVEKRKKNWTCREPQGTRLLVKKSREEKTTCNSASRLFMRQCSIIPCYFCRAKETVVWHCPRTPQAAVKAEEGEKASSFRKQTASLLLHQPNRLNYYWARISSVKSRVSKVVHEKRVE